MKIRKRSVGFFILAVLVVTALGRLPVDQLDTVQAESAAKNKKPLQQKKPKASLDKRPEKTTALLTIYDNGEIRVPKERPPKKKPKPQKKKFQPPQAKPVPVRPIKIEKPIPASIKSDGKWPVLEVGYEGIGFERYLSIIERLGNVFVLVETDKGRRLGPEVSLSARRFLPQPRTPPMLAMERPHLISDERITELLPAVGVTRKIIPGHVVLILEKEVDALLWKAIKDFLGDQGLSLDQISRISGEYTNADDGICLKLNSVDIRESGATVVLGNDVRVWL